MDQNETLIVGSIYRYPTNDFKCFKDAYIYVLKSFKQSHTFLTLEGFNISYDKMDNSHNFQVCKSSSLRGLRVINKQVDWYHNNFK